MAWAWLANFWNKIIPSGPDAGETLGEQTAVELKAYFKANPTDDQVLKKQRRQAYFHRVLVEKYDIDNLTVAQMDSKIEPTCIELRVQWSVIRKEKRLTELAAQQVIIYKQRHAAWVAAGEPADGLQGVNGDIFVRAE